MPVSDSSGYDLFHPVTIKLPNELAEISGIVYYPKDTALFAIKDEDGVFYKINLNKKDAIKKWRFDKKQDFEELVLHDSIFYVLISNGDIESIQFGSGNSIVVNKSKFPEESKNKNEFEAMYYDDSLQQLILLCKNCEGDGHKMVTAWGYNITTGVYSPMVYTIDVMLIAKKLGMEKINFKPSAVAVNPVTNELYILASVNGLLVITDRKGMFIDLIELDPLIYKQPEGIAFTPKGNVIISNEATEASSGNILIIRKKRKMQ